MAERKYMVTGYGAKKDTGELYSRASRVKEDEKNHTYGYLDEKDRYYIDGEIRPLGTIITLELTEA